MNEMKEAYIIGSRDLVLLVWLALVYGPSCHGFGYG
jgi:hypothetical protein